MAGTTVRKEARVEQRGSLGADIGRGAVGGAVAGIIFGAANMWYASSTGMPSVMPLQMIATIVQGEGALADGSASPVLGAVVHMVLSVAFGVGLGLLLHRIAADATRATIGLFYGLALYLVNFLVIAPIAFPVFREANQPFELVVHVVFGAVAVLFLLQHRVGRRD
jgi:hypothetical protein